MEIKLNKKYKYLLLIILFTNNSFAEKKPVTVNKEIVKNFVTKTPVKRDLHTKNPLIGINLDFTRRFNISNEIIYESTPNEVESLLNQNSSSVELKPGEYIRITDSRNKAFLFDGSFIVEFKEIPNLENFAINNDMTFIGNLSDIKMGVFKPRNVKDLDTKIKNFALNDNIVSVSLNLVDPEIKPE